MCSDFSMTHLTSMLRRIAVLALAALVFGTPVHAQQLVGIAPTGDPNEILPDFVLADQKVDDVLQTLEWLTGRSVVRTQALPTPTITFNNGFNKQKFTKAEAVIAIESLLSINGIGLTPLGDKFIKVIPLGQVQQEAPELVVGSLKDVPASGRVVSKLFRLQYLDPQQFTVQLSPFLSLQKVATFQNSNTVIVTDTISNLQRVETLLVEIDKRLNIETKFYQIQYAAATELAQSIRATIDSAKSGSGGGRVVVQQGGAPGAPGGGGAVVMGGGAQQIVLSTNTAINADERTNQLIVITDPANIPFFDDMIAKLDVPADPPTAIEVIPMLYADAEELAGLLSELVSGRSQSSRRGGDRSDASARANQMRPTFPTPPTPATTATPERLQAVQSAVQGVLEATGSQFSEVMTIIADTRTNAVIVSGTNNDLGLIKGVISQLDILLAQVRIEVVIAEVTLGNGYARGIDAFKVNYTEIDRPAVGQPGDPDYQPALKAGQLLTSGAFGPIAAIVSGFTGNGGLDNSSIDAIVSAGRTNSDVNVLSVPTITTLHNKEATFIAGESRPLITGTVNNGQIGGTTSTVQYQDIAIELVVTPKVGPNNVIEMEIDQKVDDVGEEVEIDGNKQPAIIRRQATSTVSVQDGQLIVLGGLQRSRISKSRNRMFLLGDIPGLDAIFSRKVESTQKVELLVFIKPTVVRTMEKAHADAVESMNDVNLSEENAAMLEKVTGVPHTPPPPPAEEPKGPAKPKRPADR
jgi:general secretion pathway protein D